MQEEVLETTLNENNIVETEVTSIQKDIELDHSKLNNLDYEHSGHTGFQPAGNYIEDSNYTHTDNNYTTEEKAKLAGLSNYDDTLLTNRISNAEEDIDTLEEMEVAQNEEINDIKLLYSLKSQTGASIELSINSSTYVMTLSLKNNNGEVLSTDNIDLPLETMVVGASYDSATKEIVLTLKNGTTTRFSVADLVNGLQSEITSTNKLDSSLIDDSLSDNKFVTPTEKNAWNNKSDFSGDYNDLTNKPTIPTQLSQLSDDSTHRLVSDTEKSTWNNKQDTLASGTNIKTINNESILGSGNINISGSTGLFQAEYGVTTLAEIQQAIANNNIVYCKVDSRYAFLAYGSGNNYEFQYYRSVISHTILSRDEVYVYKISSSGWTMTTRYTEVGMVAGTGIRLTNTTNERVTIAVDTSTIATKQYVDDIVGSINTALSSLVTVGGNE